MAIRSLGWLNVWPLQSWLFRSRSGLVGAGTRTMPVQEGGETEPDIKDKAPNLIVLLEQAERMIRPMGLDIVEVVVEQLDADTVQPWARADTPLAVHIPIVTNPCASLYSGVMQATPIPGAVLLVDTGMWHSAANFGDTPRIHLALRLAQRQGGAA